MGGEVNVLNELGSIWCEALEIGEIDVDVEVFVYGANSISIAFAIDKIETKYQLEASLSDVFRYPTIRSFSKFVMDKLAEK